MHYIYQQHKFLQILAFICATIAIAVMQNPTIAFTLSALDIRIQTLVTCILRLIIAVATISMGLHTLMIFMQILNFGFIQQYSKPLLIIVSWNCKVMGMHRKTISCII